MRIETILNHCYRHKSFVYGECRWTEIGKTKSLMAKIMPRKNGLAECSICGKVCPVYDHLGERQFDFVPFWNIPVYFSYRMRRVKCPEHGIKVERVPWAEGKSHLTEDCGDILNHDHPHQGQYLQKHISGNTDP